MKCYVCFAAHRIERQFVINVNIDEGSYLVGCQCGLAVGFIDRQNTKIAYINTKDVSLVDTVPITRVHSIDHIVHRWSQVNPPLELHCRDNYIGITETTLVSNADEPLHINDLKYVPYTHPSKSDYIVDCFSFHFLLVDSY